MVLIGYATKVERSMYQATLIVIIEIIESAAQREVNHCVGIESDFINFIIFIFVVDISAITGIRWIADVACSSVVVGGRNYRWR